MEADLRHFGRSFRDRGGQREAAKRNHLLKLAETANIKLASLVAKDVFGISAQLMLHALVRASAMWTSAKPLYWKAESRVEGNLEKREVQATFFVTQANAQSFAIILQVPDFGERLAHHSQKRVRTVFSLEQAPGLFPTLSPQNQKTEGCFGRMSSLRHILLLVLVTGVLADLVGRTGKINTGPNPPPVGGLMSNPNFMSLGQQQVSIPSTPQDLTMLNARSGRANVTSLTPDLVLALYAILRDASNLPLVVELSGTSAPPSGSRNIVSITGQLALSVSQVNISPAQFPRTWPKTHFQMLARAGVPHNVGFAAGYAELLGMQTKEFNRTASVCRSERGVAPDTPLRVLPSSLSFTSQLVNSTSAPQSVTLTNCGTTSITISQVSTPAPFGVTGFTESSTLNTGQKLQLSVTFSPTSATSVSGKLTITSTDPWSLNVVPLSGTGLPQSSLDLTLPNCGISSTANIIPNASAYRNFAPPPVGGTYTDPGGYCTVKRITNVGSGGQLIPFYSLLQSISTADTKILTYNGDGVGWHYQFYDFNGKIVISGSAFESAASENQAQPHFDRFNDAVVWETTGNSIEKCIITMGTPGSISCVITHTFTEYQAGVILPGDNDMNENGWLPMAGQKIASTGVIDIFMFQPNTNTKAGVYTTTCTGNINDAQPGSGCVHRLTSTPNNGMTIEGANLGKGQYLWNPPFTGAPVLWNPSSDHHATGYYTDGKTLVGLFDDFDHDNTGGICGFKLTTVFFSNTSPPYGNNCPLSSRLGAHVSYMDHASRPWFIWTAMANGSAAELFSNEPGYDDPSRSNWLPYQTEVVMARIDSKGGVEASKIFRLALTHARQHSLQYWSDIYAGISWDGRYVVFSSNAAYNPNGCPSGGFLGDCGDTYLIGPLF